MTLIRDGFQSADLDAPVVLPTLNLDFANSQSLDERITFSRGSIGTRVNANGLIETIDANQPRFDFDPITGECKGLLIEESRTNLLTYSEDFTNAVWGAAQNRATRITQTGVDDPRGGFTAATYKNGGRTDLELVYRLVSGTIGIPYTYSVWLRRRVGNGTIRLIVGDNITQIVTVTNQWTRVFATNTPTTTNVRAYVQILGIGDEVDIWGAQLEQGSFPTSYIPTVASTVTRSAELAEITGTNFSSWYNQSEGTFFLDGTLPFTANDTVNRLPFGVSNGFNFSNSMYFGKVATSLELSFNVINNGVNQSSALTANMTSSRFKISTAFADKNIYSCGYGGTVNKSIRPSASIPTVNRLTLGKEPWNAGFFNPIIGCIRKFAYYPKALSPSQLQYLTQ